VILHNSTQLIEELLVSSFFYSVIFTLYLALISFLRLSDMYRSRILRLSLHRAFYHSNGSRFSSPLLVFGTGKAFTFAGRSRFLRFRYPLSPIQGVSTTIRSSYFLILCSICIVSPMSSSPLTKQCFLNSSTSKFAILCPASSLISWAGRSISISFPALASSAILPRTTRSGIAIGSIPFLNVLLKKMSA